MIILLLATFVPVRACILLAIFSFPLRVSSCFNVRASGSALACGYSDCVGLAQGGKGLNPNCCIPYAKPSAPWSVRITMSKCPA